MKAPRVRKTYESQACARGDHHLCVRYWCTCGHHGPLREGDLAKEDRYHEWHRPGEYPDTCSVCADELARGATAAGALAHARPPEPPPWWLRLWWRVQAAWWAERPREH